MKAGTIKGADIEVGQVVKIGCRWLRVVGFQGDWESGMRFITAAQHDKDPRIATLYPHNRKTCKWRVIWADRNYPTRVQPAPVWDWVTQRIEQKAETS